MNITPLVGLSGSSNGKPVLVAATSIGSGTTIHTATSDTVGFDEITLYVNNVDSAVHQLTLGWGGVTDPDQLVCKTLSIPANSGPVPLLTLRLNNSLIVKAAADAANKLLISGTVNRYL